MEHLDVIIVGAGISGISAAVHLGKACPERSVGILERRENIGGTWDLFKYPGIRSDSDMHTLGFSFKPWMAEKSMPTACECITWMRPANIGWQSIRFSHKVVAAEWCSADARWVLTVDQGEVQKQISSNFLFMCSGYYSYDQPYDAQIPGIESFSGDVVHPQFWPESLDYRGKRVVVIGSGATAVTIVPSMAQGGAQVTMLQRSPTYMVARPDQDAIANFLRKVLPDSWAYALTRFKNVGLQNFFYKRARTAPEKVRAQLLGLVKQMLPEGYDVEKHFTPRYNPWDQRLCLVPNSDLFKAIRNGSVEIVTDEIETVTADGLRLKSGAELPADIVVTATGLQLSVLADVPFTVDGEAVDFPNTYTYRGMMFSGVPNLVSTFGYINASWTLRADLTQSGMPTATAHGRCRRDRSATAAKILVCKPSLDCRFSSRLMQRVMHLFPKQGTGPWRNTQDFALDKKTIRTGPVADSALVFSASVNDSADAEESQQAVSAG